MNLELLDPFGRQVPDRVDATISLPEPLHPLEARDPDDDEWKAAYHVAYNRRGTYIAVGYGSGVTAVYSTLNRTLVALYPHHSPNGCSAISWSRRSRAMMAGSSGDSSIRFYDTSHPFGPENASSGLLQANNNKPSANKNNNNNDDDDEPTPRARKPSKKADGHAKFQKLYAPNEIPPDHMYSQTQHLPFKDVDRRYRVVKDTRRLPVQMVTPGRPIVSPHHPSSSHKHATAKQQHNPSSAMPRASSPQPRVKYPCVEVTLPVAVGGSVQLNPRRPHCALAVLSTGALVLVQIPPDSMVTDRENDDDNSNDAALVYALYEPAAGAAAGVTCAAFGPCGNRVYAALETGPCLGWDVERLWPELTTEVAPPRPPVAFEFATAACRVWQLLVSRNGKHLVLNSADGAIRVYNAERLWNSTSNNPKSSHSQKQQQSQSPQSPDDNAEEDPYKPAHVFQDVVTKVKFASTDLSGDGEYIVGGANGADNKYELYIWNTSTGALMDKLTGQSTQLYAVAWHPTRSFLAVACADGLVDIWGPRINWTAFAPDFQALPMNVEYIEREDEFDVDEHGQHLAAAADVHADAPNTELYQTVDVTTIEPVPVFASDSEDEEDVFYFESKLKNALSGFKNAGRIRPSKNDDDL